jgi:hypothetical protein
MKNLTLTRQQAANLNNIVKRVKEDFETDGGNELEYNVAVEVMNQLMVQP